MWILRTGAPCCDLPEIYGETGRMLIVDFVANEIVVYSKISLLNEMIEELGFE